MSQNIPHSDVLVVGAGIAGLMAANQLQDSGLSVIVVDRNQRVGGRMVTEHLGPGWADSGAQFFTVREASFQEHVDHWLEAGIVFEWSHGWSDGSSEGSSADNYPRYAGREGMTAIPRHLAQNITVHKAVRAVSVSSDEDGWYLMTGSGNRYRCKALILTPPVPHSLALLNRGGVPLRETDRAALADITYAPGICGLFWVEGEVNLPEPGALHRPEHRVSWIADNQQKGISREATVVTVQVNPEYSRLWWQSPEAELTGGLRRELRPFLAHTTTINEVQIHRWRHALPTKLHAERTLLADELPPLAFAGDAFNGPRVEGAALSGLAAARMIHRSLSA